MLPASDVADIAASFQRAVVERCSIARSRRRAGWCAQHRHCRRRLGKQPLRAEAEARGAARDSGIHSADSRCRPTTPR
jgi:hypothetical protein